MKIAVRASASHAIGFGHVARVVAVVEELRARALAPQIMFDGDATLAAWAAARGLALAPPTSTEDFDLVIVDGPHLLDATRARRLVAIDDGGTAARVDVVVNHNVHAGDLAYPHARRRLLGRDYLMLRRDVRDKGRGACTPRARATRVVLSFGGSDPPRATARVLRALAAERPLDLDVILGPGYRDDDGALEHAVASATRARHRVTIYRAPADPAVLFVRADAAITSAGGTLGELAYLGCPALAFAIAPDQRAPARELTKLGAIAGGQAWPELDDDALALAVRGFLTDDVARGAIRDVALASADGAGPRRIVDAILQVH
ncbi:MAG: hypothetical protein NT062_06520 [Proteobacteria bacterium]|nr:hypothetical protein [Pseudomonadota bacterium]